MVSPLHVLFDETGIRESSSSHNIFFVIFLKLFAQMYNMFLETACLDNEYISKICDLFQRYTQFQTSLMQELFGGIKNNFKNI